MNHRHLIYILNTFIFIFVFNNLHPMFLHIVCNKMEMISLGTLHAPLEGLKQITIMRSKIERVMLQLLKF
jgi:hypothetical protein